MCVYFYCINNLGGAYTFLCVDNLSCSSVCCSCTSLGLVVHIIYCLCESQLLPCVKPLGTINQVIIYTWSHSEPCVKKPERHLVYYHSRLLMPIHFLPILLIDWQIFSALFNVLCKLWLTSARVNLMVWQSKDFWINSQNYYFHILLIHVQARQSLPHPTIDFFFYCCFRFPLFFLRSLFWDCVLNCKISSDC